MLAGSFTLIRCNLGCYEQILIYMGAPVPVKQPEVERRAAPWVLAFLLIRERGAIFNKHFSALKNSGSDKFSVGNVPGGLAFPFISSPHKRYDKEPGYFFQIFNERLSKYLLKNIFKKH